MKGSMKFGGKLLEYMPDDMPFREGYRQVIYNAVVQLEDMGELPFPPNIRELSGAKRTCCQRHLNALVSEGMLEVKYGKVKMKGSTVIAGVYSSKPKKDKNKKTKSKR